MYFARVSAHEIGHGRAEGGAHTVGSRSRQARGRISDAPDLGEAPVSGENDLVPLVLGFEHLGSNRTGLKYKLSVAGSGLARIKVWNDPGEAASVVLGALLPVPESGSRTVWVEGKELSQVEGDVQLEMEVLAPTYSGGLLVIAADDVLETVINTSALLALGERRSRDWLAPLFPRPGFIPC